MTTFERNVFKTSCIMKKYILPFVVLTALLTACGKKMCCVLPQETYITADKNNTKWRADASSNLRQDTIALFGTNFSTQLEETLTMQFKASAPGTYSLKGSQALYYNTIGRDVITSEYELDDTYANTVNITAYDNANKLVTGTFNLKFKHTYPPDKPASLQFLNGQFKVALH
jgi:predicted small lipoprotein YifL